MMENNFEHELIETVYQVTDQLGRLIDLDLWDDGRYAAVFRHEGKCTINFFGHIMPLMVNLQPTYIRIMDEHRFLLVCSRADLGEKNACIFDETGQIIVNFAIGDAVEDIIILADKIVFTYFDEGIFSDDPLSQEGITIFNFNGEYKVGYRSCFGSTAEDISDCYCAYTVRHTANEFYFCAYDKFRLVNWNLDTLQQEITPIPESLHGASALTTDGTTFYFYGPYDGKSSIYAWEPGLEYPKRIGPTYYHPRGLSDGRFLLLGYDSYTIIEIKHILS